MPIIDTHSAPRRLLAVNLFWLLLLAGPASLSLASGTARDGADTTSTPPEILPLDAVEPGMAVVAYTVFHGTEIEPVHGTVLGVVRNYLGPQRPVVIVMFEGDRIRHTGIVHGMSGSPVYADDRLIGAISLALGPFPKDPVAGVTPIESMMADTGDTSAPSQRASAAVPLPDDGGLRSSHLSWVGTTGFGGGSLKLLQAPLLAAGIDPEVFHWFAEAFDWAGPVTFAGGGGVVASPVAVAAAGGGQRLSRAQGDGGVLKPGSPVAGILVSGDAVLAATGTVTYVNGDQVLAFGHRFMQQGRLAIPMATAQIVVTVADQTYPYKLANPGPIVGTMTQDQVAAVAGRIGPIPDTLPLNITIRRDKHVSSHYSFRVADVPALTPTLVQLLVANTMRAQWQYVSEGTYVVSARLRLRNGIEVPVQQVFSVTSRVPAGVGLVDIARDVGMPFSRLYKNPFGKVSFESVDLDIEVGDAIRLYRITGVQPARDRVRAGESLAIRVDLERYRGGTEHRDVVVPIPSGMTANKCWIQVVDAATADNPGAPAGKIPVDQANSLDQLVDILAHARRADRCYLQLVVKRPGIVIQNRRLTSLPGTAAAVLEASEGKDAPALLEDAVIWERALDFEGVVTGSKKIEIAVRPHR